MHNWSDWSLTTISEAHAIARLITTAFQISSQIGCLTFSDSNPRILLPEARKAVETCLVKRAVFMEWVPDGISLHTFRGLSHIRMHMALEFPFRSLALCTSLERLEFVDEYLRFYRSLFHDLFDMLASLENSPLRVIIWYYGKAGASGGKEVFDAYLDIYARLEVVGWTCEEDMRTRCIIMSRTI